MLLPNGKLNNPKIKTGKNPICLATLLTNSPLGHQKLKILSIPNENTGTKGIPYCRANLMKPKRDFKYKTPITNRSDRLIHDDGDNGEEDDDEHDYNEEENNDVEEE
jgi:hypothetical protein